MSETGVSWWLDDHKRWRHGRPPAGWTRGNDGRWRPPNGSQDQTTEELVVIGASWCDPPAVGPPTLRSRGARHLTGGSGGNRPSLPGWIKVGVPASIVVVGALAMAGALAIAGEARDARDPVDEGAAPAIAPDVAPPTTTSSGSPTAPVEAAADPAGESTPETPRPARPAPTTATTLSPPATPTSPTTEPASPVPSDPLAACSSGQRSMIERGNHPWEWYVARFDADGDGILCT
jgi:hypothetical protein